MPAPAPTHRPDHAVILFAHGARDARWSRTLETLAAQLHGRLPASFIGIAFLEFQPPTLQAALADAVTAGATRIDVMPVFWSSGGHVANDVPPLLEQIRAAHPRVALRMLPVLSELPGMLAFIAEAVVQAAAAPPPRAPGMTG
jgi:sirohydrochlorin cobaltochelatase